MFLESLTLLGKKQRMWINKFKAALIQKDTDSINALLDKVPIFSDKKDIEQAMFLIKEATLVLYKLQDEITLSKKQIKQNLNFLGSTLANSVSNFNIKS
mgnify:FL=1